MVDVIARRHDHTLALGPARLRARTWRPHDAARTTELDVRILGHHYLNVRLDLVHMRSPTCRVVRVELSSGEAATHG